MKAQQETLEENQPENASRAKQREASMIIIDERNKIEFHEGSWRILHWEPEIPLTNLNVWNCKVTFYIKLGDALFHFCNMYVLPNIKELKEISATLEEFHKLVVKSCFEMDQKIKSLISNESNN